MSQGRADLIWTAYFMALCEAAPHTQRFDWLLAQLDRLERLYT